jgi:hypothetical protein
MHSLIQAGVGREIGVDRQRGVMLGEAAHARVIWTGRRSTGTGWHVCS